MWVVEDWRDIDWSRQSLIDKRYQINSVYPAYDQLVERLSLRHWWNKIESYCLQD